MTEPLKIFLTLSTTVDDFVLTDDKETSSDCQEPQNIGKDKALVTIRIW